METFQAAVVNIWDQLGDCLREATSIIVGKRQSKVPGTSVRTREQLSLQGGKPPPAKLHTWDPIYCWGA